MTYDRAGYGWSDAGTSQQTGDDVAADLHALLVNAGLTPPYVLVGHSLGGLYVRSFTAKYPAEVAGLVLVDSSHEQMLEQIRAELGDPAIAQVLAMNLAMTAAPPRGRPRRRADARRTRRGTEAVRWRDRRRGRPPHRALPAIVVAARQIAASRGMRETMRALEGVALPDGLPLAVVTAAEPPAGDTSMLARIRPLWSELQADLATRSTRSLHLTASRGGHFVHHDDPDTVLEAIRWVLEASASHSAARGSNAPETDYVRPPCWAAGSSPCSYSSRPPAVATAVTRQLPTRRRTRLPTMTVARMVRKVSPTMRRTMVPPVRRSISPRLTPAR